MWPAAINIGPKLSISKIINQKTLISVKKVCTRKIFSHCKILLLINFILRECAYTVINTRFELGLEQGFPYFPDLTQVWLFLFCFFKIYQFRKKGYFLNTQVGIAKEEICVKCQDDDSDFEILLHFEAAIVLE